MIKFFRRIRQKLLVENKLGSYLIYAIGEIVLVVIGILIALQINTWNEGRKSSKKEKQYIKRLIAEAKQDIMTFTEQVDFLEVGIESVTAFSKALNDLAVSDSAVVAAAQHYNTFGSIVPVFSTSQSTFDDLSSTGNLEVIKDGKVRDLIVKHYAQADLIKERLNINNEWALSLDGPFMVKHNMMQFEKSTAHFFPKRSVTEMAIELRKDRIAFINNITTHLWINQDAINELLKIRRQTSELIKTLTDYLNEQCQVSTKPDLPDPLAAGWEGEKVCEVIEENESLRILKCVFPPGVGHEKHYHSPHTGYTLVGGKFQITDTTGTRTVEVPTGYDFGNDEVSVHEVLNIGETTAEFLIIEPKQ